MAVEGGRVSAQDTSFFSSFSGSGVGGDAWHARARWVGTKFRGLDEFQSDRGGGGFLFRLSRDLSLPGHSWRRGRVGGSQRRGLGGCAWVQTVAWALRGGTAWVNQSEATLLGSYQEGFGLPPCAC